MRSDLRIAAAQRQAATSEAGAESLCRLAISLGRDCVRAEAAAWRLVRAGDALVRTAEAFHADATSATVAAYGAAVAEWRAAAAVPALPGAEGE
jgi:hypothetical protein